jgi:hypothetical protein
MRGRKAFVCLTLIVLVAASAPTEILVWDNDNWKTFADPEGGGYVGCEYGIVKALEANGHSPSVLNALPASLSGNEAIFVVLGWC